MNLLVDIGNTEITIYIENEYEDFKKYKFNSYPNENITMELQRVLKDSFFETIIVSSVVPIMYKEVEKYLTKICNKFINFNFNEFSKCINFGDLDFKNMGADRVVVDYASVSEYGDNLIIFDLGTAITLDVFKEKLLINGYIFPGLKLLRKSLVDGTSLLSTFHFGKLNENNMCLDTKSQLNDGIVYGLIGAINQYIKENKKHFISDSKIIITGGGLYQLIDYVGEDKLYELLEDEILFDNNLMYKGLSKIARLY